MRLAGIVLAGLLLVLGAAASLMPGPVSPTPTASETPTSSVSEPAVSPPVVSPSPSDPPDLDPPVMTGAIRVGERPVAIALDGGAGLGYTANDNGGDVSVIDLASGVETGALTVPGQPSAVAAGRSALYVADRSGAKVRAINATTGARLFGWKVGRRPVALAVDPGRDQLHVAVRDAVETYDARSGELVGRVAADHPGDLAFDPRTGRLWVLFGERGDVAAYLPATGEWADTDLGGTGATGLDLDATRGRLYLVGPDAVLAEHDLVTSAVRRFLLPQPATALRVDPGSQIAYLVDPEGNCVIALSLA